MEGEDEEDGVGIDEVVGIGDQELNAGSEKDNEIIELSIVG